MAVKLLTLRIYQRVPRCFSFNSYISSISCANIIQTTPETNQYPAFTSEFESKIQFLINKLHPESLNQVLDSTADVNSSLKLFKWASLQKKFKHNADTYYRIILKLGMAGIIEEMEGYCNEMVKERFPGFGEALLGLLDCFVENRRVDEALRVLFCVNSTSFKPNVGLFNKLMGAVVEENKDFRNVLFVYKEMVKAGIVPNVDTVNFLLEASFKAGRVDTALDQYRRMDKKGCSPDSRTFEILVSGLIASERVTESCLILDEMIKVGCQPGSKFYTRVIPLFVRVKKPEVVMKLFRLLRASQIYPDSATYGVIIQSFCKNDQICDARNLLDEMMNRSLIPEDVVFMDMINGFCRLNKLDQATQFLKDRKIVRTCTHNALIGAYCNAGKFAVAKDLFDELSHRNITNTLSWNILIRYICEHAGTNKGMELLCRMLVSSFIPDSDTYSALIIGKCKLGAVEDAMMFYRQVLANGWAIDSVSYAEFVASLCQRKKFQEAADVFYYMSTKDCSLSTSSFDKLIKGICETGQIGLAIKLFSLGFYCSSHWSSDSYDSILCGLSKSGNAKGVLIMLSRLVVVGCTLDAKMYGIFLQAMVLLHRRRDCALIFSMMLAECLLPDSKTLADLLSLFSKSHQLHMIFSGIDKQVFNCKIPDSATYNMLIIGLWKEGYRTTASQLLDKMLEEGWVPDASTHAMLMGYYQNDKANIWQSSGRSTANPDQVSNILMEGFGDV